MPTPINAHTLCIGVCVCIFNWHVVFNKHLEIYLEKYYCVSNIVFLCKDMACCVLCGPRGKTKFTEATTQLQKDNKMYCLCVFVSPSAIVPLWRPDWNRPLQTSSFPVGLGEGRGHWCRPQTDGGRCITPAGIKVVAVSVNIFFFFQINCWESQSFKCIKSIIH